MTYRAKDLPVWVRFRPKRRDAGIAGLPLSDIVTAALLIQSGKLADHITRNNAVLEQMRALKPI